MNPYFIHIGFSKCASTFLQSYFKKNDQIYYIEKSHYFSSLYDVYNKGAVYYHSLFRNSKENDIKLESDEHIILPDYHPILKSHGTTLNSVNDVLSRIKKDIPYARIILVIRNQYDLIISRYAQYIVGGGKLSFDQFVEEILYCSTDGKNYYENYYYIIINKLYKLFGNKSVLVVLQEKLKENPDIVMRQIVNFLGFNSDVIIKKTIKNKRKGLSLLGLKILRFFNSFIVLTNKTINKPTKTIIPRIIYKNLLVRGIRLIDYFLPEKLTKSKIQLLDKNTIRKLENLFKEDNAKLNELFKINIKTLGYK